MKGKGTTRWQNAANKQEKKGKNQKKKIEKNVGEILIE